LFEQVTHFSTNILLLDRLTKNHTRTEVKSKKLFVMEAYVNILQSTILDDKLPSWYSVQLCTRVEILSWIKNQQSG